MAFHHTKLFRTPLGCLSQISLFLHRELSHNRDHILSLSSLSLSLSLHLSLSSTAMNNFAMKPAGGTQLILLLLIAHFTISPGRCHEVEMRPVESTQYQVVEAAVMGSHSHLEGRRRRLEPFQLCLVCKCCTAGGGGDPTTGTCASMPCCFGIDCQLPNKPFGVCAFVPKTCNCTSCAV